MPNDSADTMVEQPQPPRWHDKVPRPPAIKPLAFAPYGTIVGATPAIPEYYWNVVSDEQRWKFICVNFQAMIDYLNMLASHFPIDTADLADGGVTDVKLGADVPDVRAWSTDEIIIEPNSYVHVILNYPTHYGTGTPIVTATPVQADDSNLTVIVTSVSETNVHLTVLNNSNNQATGTVAVIAYWAERKDNHAE